MATRDKIDELYDDLKSMGAVSKSRENFRAKMLAPGKEGYKNRKMLFDAMKADGLDAGNDYGEFSQRIGLHAVAPKKQADRPARVEIAPQPQEEKSTAEQSKREEKPLTPLQRAAFAGAAGDIAAQAMRPVKRFDAKIENIKKGTRFGGPVSERKLNPETGKWEKKYYTATGEEVSTPLEQAEKNAKSREEWETTTPEGIESRQRRIENAYEERVGDVMRKYDPDNAAEAAWRQAEQREQEAVNKHNDAIWRGFGGGREMRMVNTGLAAYSNMVDHLKSHDLQRMADDAWNRLGKKKQEEITTDLYGMLRNRYPDADDEALKKAAASMARQQSDRRMFELAVEKNAPKSATDFFFRKAIGQNAVVKLTEALARSSAGTTGDMEARDVAENRFDKGVKNKAAGIAGTVAGFAFDPLTVLSAGVGSGAVKAATWLGGKALGAAATRKAASTLGGRMVAGALGGAANFGTYEAGNEALDQLRWGGKLDVDKETGRYKVGSYSPSTIAKQFGHGLLMGGSTGVIAPMLGNVSDKLVRATGSTAGKLGVRAGELGVGTLAEGTIFSAPSFVSTYNDYAKEIESLSDKDSPNYIADEEKRAQMIEQLRKSRGEAMMDVWTDNMAMMAGFKGQSLIKSVPRRIAELSHNPRSKAGFETRLRASLDGRDGLALTKDEKRELSEGGYGDLNEFVEGAQNHMKNRKAEAEARDANGDSRYEEVSPDTPEGVVKGSEALPLGRFAELMNDGNISEAARAKMYYYLTGNALPMSTVMGGSLNEVKDADGKVGGYNVQSLGANGVITSRTFDTRERADREMERINRQAELNGFDVGERYYDRKGDDRRMRDACEAVSRDSGAPANMLFELMQRKPEEMNDVEQQWAGKILNAYDELGDKYSSSEVRSEINEQYGVDVDKAIGKERNRRSENEQEAVEDYAQRLFAGVKRGEEAGAEAERPSAAADVPPALPGGGGGDDHAEPQRDPISEAFERGRNADVQERRDIAIELGADDQNSEAHAERQGAWNGVVQRINEDADYIAAQQRERGKRMMGADGALHPATLKEKDEDGKDKTVYIVEGNVNMMADGSMVDPETSDSSVIVYDPETGERKMIAPTADTGLLSVGEVVSGEDFNAGIEQQKRDYIQAQIDEAQGTVRVAPGQNIVLPTGEQALVVAVGEDGESITVQLADGRQAQVARGDLQRVADEAAVADYKKRHGTETEPEEEPAEAENVEAAEAESPQGVAPHYEMNDEVVVRDGEGNPVKGTIQAVDNLAGTVEVATETPIDGKVVNVFPKAEFESMLERVGAEAEEEPQSESGATEQHEEIGKRIDGAPVDYTEGIELSVRDDDGNERPATVTGRVRFENGRFVPDANGSIVEFVEDGDVKHEHINNLNERVASYMPAKSSEEPVEEELPKEEEQPKEERPKEEEQPLQAEEQPLPSEEAAKQEEPMPMGKDGEEDWGAATPERARRYIYNEAGLSRSEGNEFVKARMKAARETLAKTQAAPMPKMGTSIKKYNEAKAKRQAKIEEAQKAVDYWQQVSSAQNEIYRAEEAKREAEENARRQALAQKSDGTLNGVPEWEDDTPQDARARGYRRVAAVKYDRQEPVAAVKGKEVEVKFTDRVKQKGDVALVDADSLQPSHINGQRNPAFFLDEAQPKERTDQASLLAAEDMARHINPEEITGSVTAYSGAPVVNSRGEVIQGNNRSAALKLMWRDNAPQAEKYKQYLKDHAADFGLTAEEVDGMAHPVLVNMADVDDGKAIELGQYDVKDTETGGTERIKAKNTMQKMREGGDMSSFANILLKSEDAEQSFSGLVDDNGAELLRWMQMKKYITPTQYGSAFDSRGNITAEAKNDLKSIMYQSIFRGGSTQLEEMFNRMPVKAQRAILATAFRDYDSPADERMVEELQASIRAYNALMEEPAFADAKNFEDAQRGVALWSRQTHMDFATGESYVPADNFSNFALYLAAMYKGANQGYMQGVFNRLYDLIQGKQEPDLFNPNPDNTPRTLAQAIKEVLNIDYNGKLGRNAVSDMAGYGGKDRERGGDGEPPRGGTAAEGDGTSEPASSTGESGSTKGTAPGVQGEVRGGDELHEPDERGGRETENSSRRQPSDLAQSGENGTGTASSRGDAGARQSATGAGGQGNAPAEEREGRGGASEQNTLPEKNTVGTFDPRSMTDVEKERRGEMLRDAEAVEVGKEIITSTPEMSARKAAEKWWDENVGEPALYDTEAGEVEINRNSVESSLAHRYSQMKLDAVTSLVDGFGNAVYLGTMPDSRERGVLDHYFAYPIIYGGKRCYVFCRAMQDANKNRLYVHEVFVADKIKKGNTLQTAASKPHGGIALYRDILANVLTEGDAVWRTPKDATASSAEKQGLDYARPENAEDGTKGSGITPQSTPSVGKSNEKSESAQEKVVENAGSSPIGTASSAEKVDVERQGVNTKPIEKQAKGEGGLPRTATGEDAHGNRRKIEDFGKKLGGAKKDKALDCIENLRKKSEKDIGALSKADDILSRKEILRLVSEDKMDEQSGRGLLSFNEAINPLVRVSKSMQDGDAFKTALLNRYAWHVKTWEASHDEPLSIDADAEAKFIEQATEGLNNSNRRYVASMLREWLPAIYHTYEVVGGEGRGILPYVVRPNGLSGGYWVMKPGSKKGFGLSTAARAFAKLRELCPIKEAALSDQKKIGEKNQDDVLHVVEANGRYRIKSRRVHGDVYFSGDFYSRKEADAYLKAHKDDLAAAEASYAANLGMKSVLSVEREGVDYRGGRDVSENEFLQTFGFRGVEFGNWVSDKERQPYLNTTYDALMDLAAIIDLSPKALSLGGRLGLSFGARGGGNASAHYESDHEVINLTRTKGVGSLAHEWFHAVDNYLARSKSGNMSDYGTEERGKIDGMRADLSKSFSELVDAIKSSDFHTRSLRAGKYWSRTIEEAARAFSLYVEDKLEAKSSRSPMLTRAVADNIEGQTEAEKAAIDEALKTFPYPTVSERISIDKAFDKFFDTLQEKTDPMGNVVLFHRTASTEASPVTKEQQAMVQGMAEWLRGAGIEVNTDETEGQRVLDMARSNDETLREESRRHHGAKAEERNRILNTIDEANSFVRGTTRKQERKRRLAEEKVIKENTKKLYDAVLSGNFNDVTLRLINDYLEHVTPYNPYRQPVSRRLPERVQRSLRGGKQTNCIDALFTRISESAVGASGKTVAERRRVVKAKKEELLEGWAKATGHWHTDVSDFTNEKEPLGKGKDSDVYLSKDGKSVIKVSKGKDEGRKFSSDPDAIVLYNAVFPSTRYKILGYGRIGGQFVRFLEQPIVEFKDNASISVDDRTAYMERLGFRPLNKDKTSFSNGELIVTDVQKGNIVRDKDGNVRVIDADVKLHTKDIGGEYTYPAVEADTGNGDLREMRVYHGSGADFFNEKDLKMQDKVRLFRTPNGEALGFMVGGKIYLDPRKATPETPIHEYGHIWLEALKQGNRQEYDSLMQKVRDEAKLTPIWEEIRKNYPDLSEEEMAEEVFVMYSGRKGSRRIDEEVRRTAAAEGQSPIDKAATISALERLKQAIRDVWKGILNFLHIHYKTVDEAVEQQLKDFVMQNNPREALRMSRGEETAEERSIVERAKQDGTYMKAPNGEPTKLTERQWVQVRTKAFKNWFGDWEKAARIEKLKHSKSVDVKYDNEYSLTAKDALSWIKNNLRGEYRIDDTGETVQISKVGAKEVTSHSRTDEAHLKSISAIPDMLKHAIFIDEMPNAKGNSKFDSYRYYAVGLNIDGVPYTAKIVIGVKQGKKYYDHRLTQLEKTRLIDEINQSARDFTSEGNASIPPYVEAKDTRLISLLQTNSSKIVDENGEPRVVYHGTTRDEEKRVWNENGGYYDTSHDQFTVFRRDVDGERNSGMFFNSDPDNAYGYGYYSYDTYLKLRNPLVIDCNGSNYSAIKYNGEEKDTYGWCDYAEKHGYDGVVFNNIRDGVDYGSMQTPTNDYVAFKSNQIKSATDNIGTFSDANPDIRYQLAGDMGSEEDIEAVNKRFNDELQGYTPANADSKVFDLGRPSAALLSGGVVDKPMKLYGSKIAKKIKKHGLDVEDLKDLPRAVAAPIAIFNNYEKEGNRSVLTELHTRGGNILVSLNIGKGMDVDFNIVSSMFGKGNDKVLNWLEKGYATYINKKKALDYLHLSAPIAEASDNSKLLSAATKVVKEFENPAVEGAESADDNALYRTSDEIDAEYPNWLDGTTTDSGKHSTQVAGTRKTYGHVGDWIEKHLDKGVRILDASSGMGLGTKDLRERSFNIEDVEPYQSEERKRKNPATYSSYDQVEGKYDYIISNAVLNVIPDDWRRDVLHDMADRLKTGGHMFINTRKAGEEKTIKDKIELDSPQEVLVKRNGRIASYQRFFTPEELRDYVARELGEGYKVEIADEKNSGTKGLAAVVVTKERDAGMESAVAKRETAKLLSAKLNTPIHIVEDVNEIEHPDPEAQMQRRRAKGWYDTSTGEVVVVLPNNSDVEDVAATIAHETIAHKGLRELVGEDRYDEFLDEVHDHLDAELKKEVDDEAGRNFMDDAMENSEKSQSYEEHRRRAMDELFGRLAEKPFEEMGGKERTLWQRLKEAVRRLLDKFLGTLKLPKWFKIGDNELRYMLWRSKERLERGKEDPIDFARDIVKREELGLDDAVYSMGDSPETFKARQKRAVEEKGVVMPGLNEAEVKVVDVPRHDFTGTAKEALKSAEKWAKENIVGVHKATANDGTSFEYEIANKSVEKYVSSSSTQKSDNIGIHLSVLKELPEVISHSIEAEEHPDYAKDATGIRNVDNSINSSAMIHRFYGAVRIDGKIYRVKTTIREYEDANRGNRAHSYEVTKIELVEAPSTGGTKASGEPLAMTSTNSISAAKLLQNVEKAYDKGKKLLGESRRIDMRVGKDREKKALQEKPLLWGKRDVFSSAQRIVNGENGKLLFRDKIEDTDDTAREMYNRMADEKRNIVREAWQDSMINVRNLQEAVLKQTGGQIADNEDAYLQENNMHGRARAEQEDFERNYYEPLIVEVNAVAKKAGNSIGDVVAYMKAKHGLERNEVFARRDAKAAYEQLKKKNPDATETEDDFYLKFRERDYSGLTALTGKENVVDAEVEAQRIVDAMEAKADTKELWARVNAATKKTLEKAYDSGMVSKENYEQVRDMFDYYIPLRGFTEKTAEDVYDYIDGDRGTRFSPTIYKAKGRSSESDDPIAYIGQMASSAIVQGEKNLVKRALLNFARNHPTNLITVSEMWYRNYGTKDNPDWREDVPNIPEDADGDEVAEIVRQHEADMEQLAKDGLATKKRGRLHLGMPVNKANAREHHVEVMVNGKKYVLYINGNPRAAQALNGSRTQRASEREVGILERALGKINRGLAQRYTSLSPSFTVGNAFRDLTMAFAMTNIKEGPDYARRFMANMALLGGPVRMFPLMHRYRAGKINMSNETERLFYEFMTRGGETGFTSLKEIDDYKREMERVYKNANRSVVDPRRVWNDLTDAVELTNRCIEDMTRFATYMTSRKGGKSIDRSVEDAKNITLNFNRKGTGELGNATARHLFVFVNPAIQALETIASAAKHHPVRLSVTGGLIGVIGFAQPLITAVLASAFNDDEEWDPMSEYWKLPEWQRRNNYVVWIPGTRKFAMIPLGQEFRVIHGFGETVSSIKAGKNSDDALLDVASQAADLLPLSPDGNGGNPLITFAPTTVQPLMQVGFNTDFTGRPIYKNSDWNKYEPAYQKAYIGTPEWLVRTSAGMNELTGGNAHRQGRLERTKLGEYANNPAVVNHLLKGYLGGLYSFGAQLAGSVVKAANHEAPDVQEMPIVNRVITAPREMEQSGKVRLGDDYYRIKEDHDRIGTELSGWKRDAKRGDENALKEIERMVGDSAVARYKSEGEYLRAIGQVRTAIDYTQDETRKAKLRTLLQRLQDRMSEEFK